MNRWFKALLTAAALAAHAGGTRAARAGLPQRLDLEPIRRLVVQHDGRWPPLDTVARDIVESVSGKTRVLDRDPLLVFLAWTFDPAHWSTQPLITIANAELRRELRLPADRSVFSYTELATHAPLLSLIDGLNHGEPGRKLDPLELKVSDLRDKLTTLDRVFGGKVIRPVPGPDAASAWSPIGARPRAPTTRPAGVDIRAQEDAATAWDAIKTGFLADDAPTFAAACGSLTAALSSLPAEYRPSADLINAELRYNRTGPFRTAWIILAAGAVLAGLALLVRRRWFDAAALLVVLAGFAALSYGLWLRWQIAGRVPASNMFESLLFLSWGMGVFAIVSMIVQRQRSIPLTASAMGALALILAERLPLDHFIRPIAPVLMDTVWMAIHVPIIMASYAVLALGVLVAHAQLVFMAATPHRRESVRALDSIHHWYIHVGSILLLAGIATGSMWGASSWGRYWGWDPKEVWSLIAFLGYMAIMHVRVNHEPVRGWMYAVAAVLTAGLVAILARTLQLSLLDGVLALGGATAAVALFALAHGPFAAALKSILAFWLIIMTYVGVNYVMGTGLHSYGFGTGAVARYMFLVGGADLALIGACCAAYLLRKRLGASLPAPAPV